MAMGFQSSTTGGAFTGEDLRDLVVEPLISKAAVLAAASDAGQLLVSRTGNPLRLPKLDPIALGGDTAFVPENGDIPEVNATTDNVILLPPTLRGIKRITRVSNELLRHDVTHGIESMGKRLVKDLTLAADRAMLVGDGLDGEILGLLNTPDIQTLAAGGPITTDLLHKAVGLSLMADATPSAWIMSPRTLVEIRRLKDTTGQHIVVADQERPTVPNGQSEQAHSAIYRSVIPRPVLLGLPVYVSTQVPVNQGSSPATKSTALLVDQDQLAVAIDKDFEVEVLRELFGKNDQTGIRVTGRVDCAALNPQAIVAVTGITPVA